MATVNVRYIVRDVDAAIDFYCRLLGFREEPHPVPMFAMIVRDDLRLLLSAPVRGGPGGGSQAERMIAGRAVHAVSLRRGAACFR